MTTTAARIILNLTVFTCGALVMAYEIIGSRIVSPFIGTSTYVWTSLIGVILAALSLGYWLGGKFADRNPDIKVLASAIFLAGGAVSATILLKDIILSVIASASVGLEIKSVAAAVFLFAPASIFLGFVTPYAVKLRMASLEDAGKTVGRLYALSTIGSIAGTFAAGFFLIPFVGSTRTLYLIAAVLFVLSILLAGFAFTRSNLTILTLFVLGVAGSEYSIYYLRQASGLHDFDTEYARVQVFQTVDPKNNRAFQAIATDPYFVQSAMYLDGDDPVFEYSPYYHLIRHFKPDHSHTLMIGGAGYTFPKEYLRSYTDAKIDVVEIDPQMTEIARRFFRLKDDPRMSIFHEDGRTFLNSAPSEKYDAVLMDAFGSLFSVPYQLTTIEAVREIHRVLKPGGVVIFNLGSAITGPGSQFLHAELATYKQVFLSEPGAVATGFPEGGQKYPVAAAPGSDPGHVQLFKVNLDYNDDHLQNLMIVAIKSGGDSASRGGQFPIFPPDPNSKIQNPKSTAPDPEITRLLSHRYTADLTLTTPILTDDLAPVEYYNSFAQNLYRRQR